LVVVAIVIVVVEEVDGRVGVVSGGVVVNDGGATARSMIGEF
jgi:hypothetical protein